MAKLQTSSQPIATIKAIHTGANASADDAGGLEAVVCLAKSACVMLTSNLWVDVGLIKKWSPNGKWSPTTRLFLADTPALFQRVLFCYLLSK